MIMSWIALVKSMPWLTSRPRSQENQAIKTISKLLGLKVAAFHTQFWQYVLPTYLVSRLRSLMKTLPFANIGWSGEFKFDPYLIRFIPCYRANAYPLQDAANRLSGEGGGAGGQSRKEVETGQKS